jgi:DnaJ-class molecular chaperone
VDKDLYEILGVKKESTEGEIRKAFLKFAKKYHPDVNPNNKEAEQKFKEVNLAYEVLKDSKKRAQYDQMRAAGANPFGRTSSGGAGDWRTGGTYSAQDFQDFGLGDLFQEIFGGGMGAGGFGGSTTQTRTGRRTRQGRAGASFFQRGSDRETTLQIAFTDAAKGAERTLEFSDGRRLTVKIPEGVDSGSKIRLSGQGDPGVGGAPGGDLIVTLEVQPHPQFTREGHDILLRLPITFSEAVLGGEVEIPTLDGTVVMKIPKGVSSGQRLKLGGKGIRSPKNDQRGDQFVELAIKIPRQPDGQYIDAAEKLKNDSFKPRS